MHVKFHNLISAEVLLFFLENIPGIYIAFAFFILKIKRPILPNLPLDCTNFVNIFYVIFSEIRPFICFFVCRYLLHRGKIKVFMGSSSQKHERNVDISASFVRFFFSADEGDNNDNSYISRTVITINSFFYYYRVIPLIRP